jgi:hypothetical protein
MPQKNVIDLQGRMSWSKDFLFPGTGTSYQSKLECKMAEKRKLKANKRPEISERLLPCIAEDFISPMGDVKLQPSRVLIWLPQPLSRASLARWRCEGRQEMPEGCTPYCSGVVSLMIGLKHACTAQISAAKLNRRTIAAILG